MNPVAMMQFVSASPLSNQIIRHHDDIRSKPIPRWPNRRSYASHKRKKEGTK